MSPEHLSELEILQTKFRDAPTGHIVFYGSSSVRLWPGLSRAFPAVTIENWGFGGSTLTECAQGFERFVVPRAPRALLLYAGVNDIGQGDTPTQIWEALRAILDARDAHLGAISTAFLSIKLPPPRVELRAVTEQANDWCQREIWGRDNAQWVDVYHPMLDQNQMPQPRLFAPDQLHLSRAGYDLWDEILRREVKFLGS